MKLILDLDDVLCNFVDSWNQWLFDNGYTEYLLNRLDIKTYDYYMLLGKEVHEFYNKNPEQTYTEWVAPIEGSHQFVEWCHQNFDEVMVLSHASQTDSMAAKKAFVRKHFNIKNIKFSNSIMEKYNFTKGAVLVDDYPLNVLKHIKHNDCHGICINHGKLNAWATLNNHPELVNDFSIDLNKYWEASSYYQIQVILSHLKHLKQGRNE